MGADGVGEVAAVAGMGVGEAETLAAPDAPRRQERALASLAHFSSFSTIPAPRSKLKRSAKQCRIQEVSKAIQNTRVSV